MNEQNAFFREADQHHLYRKCVGILLLNSEGMIFGGVRRDGISDVYQMPQGGIDEGESPRNSALRELYEETGIKSSDVEVLDCLDRWLYYDIPKEIACKIWEGKYMGQCQKWFAVRFMGCDSEVDINSLHPEFSSWGWFPKKFLMENVVGFKRPVYTEVFSFFNRYIV